MKRTILIKPLITEKSSDLSENQNVFGFVVDRSANKLQIKNAVEEMYNVQVNNVRTIQMPAKAKSRFTKAGVSKGRKQAYKKAYVSLPDGESIDFYSNI